MSAAHTVFSHLDSLAGVTLTNGILLSKSTVSITIVYAIAAYMHTLQARKIHIRCIKPQLASLWHKSQQP